MLQEKKKFRIKNPLHMILIVTTFLVSMPLTMLFSAWAISVSWGWFVTPAFGIPVPSLANVIGLSLLITLIKNPDNSTEKYYQKVSDEFDLFKIWVGVLLNKVFVRSLSILGISYVVKVFM